MRQPAVRRVAAFPQGTCSTRAARDPLYISLHGLASVADEAALGLRAPIESTPVDLVHGADKEQYHTSPYTACDAIADETALRLRAPIVSKPGDLVADATEQYYASSCRLMPLSRTRPLRASGLPLNPLRWASCSAAGKEQHRASSCTACTPLSQTKPP